MSCKVCGNKGHFRVLAADGVGWDARKCTCGAKTPGDIVGGIEAARADYIAAMGHAEAMARAWELMQEGLKQPLPGNSTATFVRGENELRAAVKAYRKDHPKVKTTRCLLCKTRVRCVAVSEADDASNGTRTITTKLFHDQFGDGQNMRPCRDPAARGHKPSRPPRKRR